MIPYNSKNWYWRVSGSTTDVYSSARAAYVPVSDAAYQTWLKQGKKPTLIKSHDELTEVLKAAGVLKIPVYSQRLLFRVMTDQQYATFEQTKGAQSARKKAIFDAADPLPADGPDFPEFYALMVAKFGKVEADRLLSLARV